MIFIKDFIEVKMLFKYFTPTIDNEPKISLSVRDTDKDLLHSPLHYTKGSYNDLVVSQEGLEPPTPGLEGPCSIQLSY